MTTERHASCDCPTCGTMVDARTLAETFETNGPSTGDWSVCAYCAQQLVYTESLTVRLPTKEEQAEMDAEPAMRCVVERVRFYISLGSN